MRATYLNRALPFNLRKSDERRRCDTLDCVSRYDRLVRQYSCRIEEVNCREVEDVLRNIRTDAPSSAVDPILPERKALITSPISRIRRVAVAHRIRED